MRMFAHDSCNVEMLRRGRNEQLVQYIYEVSGTISSYRLVQ